MLLKMGVDMSRLEEGLRSKLDIIDKIYIKHMGCEAVVTSTHETPHSVGSPHCDNLAINIRMAGQGALERMLLRKELGPDFVVVEEGDETHIEYNPVSH